MPSANYTRVAAAHLKPGAIIRRWRGTRHVESTITDVRIYPDRLGGRSGAYPEVRVHIFAEGEIDWHASGDTRYEVLS